MSEQERQFTPPERCAHCGHEMPLEIVASHSLVRRYDDNPRDRLARERGLIYQLLSCPACEGVTLRSYCRRLGTTDLSEVEFNTLYPDSGDRRFEYPRAIRYARSAQDAKARAVMFRRLAIIHECNRSTPSLWTSADRTAGSR